MRFSAFDTVPRYCAPGPCFADSHSPPLGPAPFGLHQLRGLLPGLFVGFTSPLWRCHYVLDRNHRLRLPRLPPTEPVPHRVAWPTMRSPGFPQQRASAHAQCPKTTPGLRALAISRPISVLLPSAEPTFGTPGLVTFAAHWWPMRSPSTLRLCPSRASAHDSGSMRFSTPSSWMDIWQPSTPCRFYRRTFPLCWPPNSDKKPIFFVPLCLFFFPPGNFCGAPVACLKRSQLTSAVAAPML